MADFKTALQALHLGEIKLADLSQQLHRLLQTTPQYSNQLRAQLDDAHAEGIINNDTYLLLKNQIIQFERGRHGDAAGDATVFAGSDSNTGSDTGDRITLEEDGYAGEDTQMAGTPPDGNTDLSGDSHNTATDGAGSITLQEDGYAGDTRMGNGEAGGFDLRTAADADSQASPDASDSSNTGNTSDSQQPSWTPPGSGELPAEMAGLGPGSVIKDRFILDDVLGSGGMGKVYKGRDLLKVEARDKNPYVALKVLNEDFKEHPEAFIALQRESSRQQRLAHPNIATVYDFDRIGRSGTAVFITMELMEGLPLNTFIKKKVKPQGGLPFAEALPIIQQLCYALAYAHKQNIVHSDFKPGNAFVCNDGTVKVLDFGIARAVKNPLVGEAGEKTLFDPGKLGALTPAYASLEMLQGEEPDTRDDIYALACVAYELLTGRHPYNKLPANAARDNNLAPAPVKGLTRRQMKGLQHGLAFERARRSPDVETFLEEFEGKANWHKNPWVISAAVVLALGIGLTGPTVNYFHEQQINDLISRVQSGDAGQIESVLTRLDELGSNDRNTITDSARDSIQRYFENRIDEHVDPEQGIYDFNSARAYLDRAETLYPDSASLRAVADRLQETRDQRLYELNKLYIAALEQNKLIPGETENDIADVSARIAEIDPDHPLLEDPRLFNAYGLAAGDELKLGNFEQAQAYIDAGLELAPNDTGLVNLQDRLDAAVAEHERQQRIAELQQNINDALGETGAITAVGDLDALQSDIVELAALHPNDPMLATLRERTRGPIDTRLEAILDAGSRADAEAFDADYGELLTALQLNEERLQLRLAHLDSAARTAAIDDMVAANQQRIDTLLQAETLDAAWQTALQNRLEELALLLPADAPALAQSRNAVGTLFSDRAARLYEDERYSEALGLLERGQQLLPQSERLAALHAEVTAAETEFLRAREEAARQARIAGLKETLQIQARAKDVESAEQTLAELRAELPADDSYLSDTAPQVLATAYARLAANHAERDDDRRAMELARAGLELTPDDQSLARALADYTVAAHSEELDQVFANAIGFDVADVRAKVEDLREFAPDSYGELEQRYVQQLGRRIRTLQDSDPGSAMRLANNASRVFPDNATLNDIQAELAPRPWPEADTAAAQLAAGRLSQANVTLAAALATDADHPDVVEFRDRLEQRIQQADAAFAEYRSALADNELDTARSALERARELWTDNPDYNDAVDTLETRVAAAKRQRESRVLQREVDVAAMDPDTDSAAQTSPAEQPWSPIASDRNCSERLAGYGRRARAICYDLIHERIRGPLMVVVPGNGEQPAFAIGKYEVSINDYNKYCYLSGNCKVEQVEDKDVPKTNLSLAEARAYTEWLSQRTGKTYRLPTRQEWTYAAAAAGEQPTKDFNCRVTLGDSVLKGTGPISVTVGRQNGWGLKNYIGNVQEWVVAGDNRIVAQGGSYQDAHSKCDLDLQHEQSGQADAVTGFRLLLEEVNQG